MPSSQNTKIELDIPSHIHEEAIKLSLAGKLEKAARLFCANPRHRSLNFEKLEPKSSGRWSIRLDIHYRLEIIRDSDNKFIALRLSNHYE